jgi:hypothetical protein
VFHIHTGSKETGDGCYTNPIYHVHTFDCYSPSGTELICGKTLRTVESYALGCGYIDIFDESSEEMQAYKAGKLTEAYVLSKSLTGRVLRCGHTEDDLIGYTMSCGLREGAYEDDNLICGKTTDTIVSWKLGCGLEEGEKITKKQAEKYNQPD